jgi:protocatechuate 3,4-dioxygenase beta subunit
VFVVSLNRKAVLQMLGLAGGGLLAANCGGGGSSSSVPTSTASSSAAATATATSSAAASATASASASASTSSTCVVTPEGEIGPYFTDDSASGYNRSNILSNLDGSDTQSGIPLTLTVIIRDSENSCALLSGAQVDIWHCNAAGLYSNESSESTTGLSWLRGYQITGSTGTVSFTTIMPGWYSGRTTHIHLRVRSSYSEASSTTDGTNTTQLFFPQTLIDTIDTTIAAYDSRGINTTANASDHVYTPETQGATLPSLSGSTSAGYTATFTVDLPITAE